jgi:hypothetical protein
VAALRQDFPNLAHYPDELFRTQQLSDIITLDNKIGGGGSGSKTSKRLMEKLSRNLDRAKKPKQVPAGLDNRSDVLHEARFLPGHICKHETLWIQARQTIGLTGLDPVSQYDFDSLGLAGKINSQIIAKLHNPGEKKFFPQNASSCCPRSG